MTPVSVTVFSDFTCPFSYVTEAALRKIASADGIDIVYRAFELYPDPAPLRWPGGSAGWNEAVRPLAAAVDIHMADPGFRPRTRKAHEAARFADARDVGSAMRAAIFEAYWGDGQDIGRVDVLMELVAALGLDPEDLKIALDLDSFTEVVLGERELAARLNISSTPTIFIGTGQDATILVGAQSSGDLKDAINIKQAQNG
ncbi:MAG TPA: DsbA family protein [Longimicrobiaceae bacterium]|nr:DsbA family protein [Longimicrobiaceae bacterium]